jgi:hypothetical protein
MTAVAARASVSRIARAFTRLGAGALALRSCLASGTGMATLDAGSDFQRARRAYVAARLVRRLTPGRPGPSRPCALDGVAALSWGVGCLRVIPLAAVIGTVDVTDDFDARFRPAARHLAVRWEHVALAHRRGVALPPISVIERPDGYYVVDGRHRVSVARALGQRDIEAWVSGVAPRRAPATPRIAINEARET